MYIYLFGFRIEETEQKWRSILHKRVLTFSEEKDGENEGGSERVRIATDAATVVCLNKNENKKKREKKKQKQRKNRRTRRRKKGK